MPTCRTCHLPVLVSVQPHVMQCVPDAHGRVSTFYEHCTCRGTDPPSRRAVPLRGYSSALDGRESGGRKLVETTQLRS